MIGNEEFRFLRGEVRKITYTLKSKKNLNFVIESAEVELYYDDELIAKLHTVINEHEIVFIIDSTELLNTYYYVIMTCKINEETVKKKMNFMVDL